MSTNTNQIGSNFDTFLAEEGILEEVNIIAVLRVITFQITQFMVSHQLSEKEMAEKINISRSQFQKLLNKDSQGITIATLVKAAKSSGLRINIELVST